MQFLLSTSVLKDRNYGQLRLVDDSQETVSTSKEFIADLTLKQ